MHRKSKSQFLKLYRDSFGQVAKSCAAMHMHVSTYHKWLANDQEFRDTIYEIDLGFVEDVEKVVKQRMDEKSDYWIYKWLTIHSEKWKAATQINNQNHSGLIKLEIVNRTNNPEAPLPPPPPNNALHPDE